MSVPPPPPANDNSIRFLLVSTHLQQFTGYSRVAQNLIQQLAKCPNIALTHFGFQKHPNAPPNHRAYPPNCTVIDAAAGEHPPNSQSGFGFSQLPDVIRKKRPHIVMIYNDMSIITKFAEEIRRSGIPNTFRLWLYVDQVYTCQLQAYIDVINRDAERVFAFSSYWRKCLKDQGVNRPIDIIHHGFDPKQYYPIPRESVRKQLSIPEDAFMYLCMNRNQPRKRYDILIMAFVELIVKNPQRPLYLMCICDKGDKGGWWLFEIYHRELKLRNVPIDLFANRLLVSSRDMSFSDNEINLFYNVANVGVSTAEGEGWGLCNFEQMGCGIPQVVPDVGGFKEFCTKENSVLVKPTMRYYLPTVYSPVGGEGELCTPHDICMGMEEYLFDTNKLTNHGKTAREKVLSYTWEKATETLIRRINETQKELVEHGEL